MIERGGVLEFCRIGLSLQLMNGVGECVGGILGLDRRMLMVRVLAPFSCGCKDPTLAWFGVWEFNVVVMT